MAVRLPMSDVYDTRNSLVVKATEIDCSDMPSLTKQSFLAECDINAIVGRFTATNVLNVRSDAQSGHYADLTTMPDYLEAHNLVVAANMAFASLDASVRRRFHNDPAEFLSFMDDPANLDEAVRLGLATKRPAPQAGSDASTVSPSGEATPPAAHSSPTAPRTQGGVAGA